MRRVDELVAADVDPTWPRPLKKTRSPGWSSERETATPTVYCVETVRGSETPTREKTYITNPEQSKPSRARSRPTVRGAQVLHRDPDDAAVLRRRGARGASALRRRRRGWSCATRAPRCGVDARLAPPLGGLELGDLVLDGVEQLLTLRERASISSCLAARSATTCSCLLRAFSSSASRCLISVRNLRTSFRICASWSVTRLAVSIPSRISSRLDEPSRISTRSGSRSGTARRGAAPACPARTEVGARDLEAVLVDLLLGLDLVELDLRRCSESITSSRLESSSWIWASTWRASACFDSIGGPGSPAPPAAAPPGRGAGRGGRVDWLVGCLPPARGPSALTPGPTPAQAGHGNRVSGRAAKPKFAGEAATPGCWYAAPFVDAGSRRPWIRFAALGALALAALLSPPRRSGRRSGDPPQRGGAAAGRENDGLAARSQTALLDLYSLETRLTRTEARLASLRARRALRAERRRPRRSGASRSPAPTSARPSGGWASGCSELYVQGEVDPLAVILAAGVPRRGPVGLRRPHAPRRPGPLDSPAASQRPARAAAIAPDARRASRTALRRRARRGRGRAGRARGGARRAGGVHRRASPLVAP